MAGLFLSTKEVRLANKKQTHKLKDRAPPQNSMVFLQDSKGGKHISDKYLKELNGNF
jgi:hypothetical protein